MGTFYLASLCLTGLIHANHGSKVMDYLSQEIKASESEVGMVVPWHEGGGGGGGGVPWPGWVWWFHGTGGCGGFMARVGVVVSWHGWV